MMPIGQISVQMQPTGVLRGIISEDTKEPVGSLICC